jgi:hypothetical protein
MKVISAICLLLLVSSYSTVQAQQKQGNIRTLSGKKDDSSSSSDENGGEDRDIDTGGGIPNPDGANRLIETKRCIPFSDDVVKAAVITGPRYENHDFACNSNTCGSVSSPGCCRYHTNLMTCDDVNDFQHQPVRDEIHLRTSTVPMNDYIFYFVYSLYCCLFHIIPVHL